MKGQTATTRWTEDERRSSGVPSEKVWWRKKKKKKKKVPKIETRSDRRGKKDRERVCKKRGCLCLSVTLSAGGGLREIMEGRMEG